VSSLPRVTGLYIYPVKSCRGIEVQELTMTSRGPAFDRQWMIVDENNQFMTLRTFAKLAEIKTAVQGPYLHLYAGSNKILVDHTQPCEQVEEVTLWDQTFKAGIENKSINEALSDFLQKTVKLARYQDESFRPLKESAVTSAVKESMFSDSRPLLLTNQNSLQDLNNKLQRSGSSLSQMERFRANVIVKNLPAYAEDQFINIKIGEVELQNGKLCERCPVITQDVETGKVVSKDTLKTLAGYRKQESNAVAFGTYFTPASIGIIRLGDSIVSN
jgi:uncharacterized protein